MSDHAIHLYEAHRKVIHWLTYQCINNIHTMDDTLSLCLSEQNANENRIEDKVNYLSKRKINKTKKKIGCSRHVTNPKNTVKVNIK